MTDFKFDRFQKKSGRLHMQPPFISITDRSIRINPRAMEILGSPRRVHLDFDKDNQAVRIVPADLDDTQAFTVTPEKWKSGPYASEADLDVIPAGKINTRLSNYMAVSKYFYHRHHGVFIRLKPHEILKLSLGWGVEEFERTPEDVPGYQKGTEVNHEHS